MAHSKKSVLFICLGEYRLNVIEKSYTCVGALVLFIYTWHCTHVLPRHKFTGNICRSPIAEAVFDKLVKDAEKQNEWIIDSGAMGNWHVGKVPDRRAISVLTKHSISTSHKARQVCQPR